MGVICMNPFRLMRRIHADYSHAVMQSCHAHYQHPHDVCWLRPHIYLKNRVN